jgi:SAM-dependent methyltransferase
MEDQSERYTEGYYDGNGQNGDRPALRLFTRLATRYLPAGKLIDFGCGPGFFLSRLRHHYQATGIESSRWAGEAAQRRTGVPIHASLDDVASGTQDALVSVHVVEHIPDEALSEVLAGWKRVLRPGGRALVITPDAQGFAHSRKGHKWIAFSDPTHINLKSHREWRDLFHGSGFKVVHCFADGLWDFPYIFRRIGRFEVFLMGWPTLLQFILARPLLPAGSGESAIFVLEREA